MEIGAQKTLTQDDAKTTDEVFSICLSVYLSVCRSLDLSYILSINCTIYCPFILSVDLFICMSVCRSYGSAYLPICLSNLLSDCQSLVIMVFWFGGMSIC